MEEQSYKKHTKLVPAYHMVLFPIIFIIFIGSLVNVYQSMGNNDRIYSASLIAAMSFAMIMQFLFARVFPLQAQDRVIRLEENLRHQRLSGKMPDSRLTRGQMIALRFAPDEEFVALAAEAANKGMSPGDIKKAIKNWRADNHRL